MLIGKVNELAKIDEFPVMRRDPDDGVVILFTSEHEGVVLVGDDSNEYQIGTYSRNFRIDNYIEVIKSVTIEVQ